MTFREKVSVFGVKIIKRFIYHQKVTRVSPVVKPVDGSPSRGSEAGARGLDNTVSSL